MYRLRTYSLLCVPAVLVLFLAGCSTSSPISEAPALRHTSQALPGPSGVVYAGSQPVSGATIQLYAVGGSGDGSPATPLLTSSVATNSSGSFSLAGLYHCQPSSEYVYITAKGGSPAPGISNPQLALMAVIGPCSTLTSATFLTINEITTEAAVYALTPYISSYSAIGSGPTDASTLDLYFSYAGFVANTATGITPGTHVPSNYSVPVDQVDIIADLLAACEDSPGGVSGDTSVCGQFFALTLPPGGTPPTDAIGALLNLANNPSLNTAALYNLIPTTKPFVPVYPLVPPNFSLRLVANSLFVASPQLVHFATAIIGFSQPTQTVSVTNGTAAAIGISSVTIIGANASDFTRVANPATDCGAIVPANTTCSYTLSFTPSGAGARAAYLLIGNSSPNPTITVALSGAGTVGTAGPVTVNPTSLSFNQSNTPQTLTLTNGGTTPLTINSIQISVANYLLNNQCGSTVAAGTSCQITVSPNVLYTPPATGTMIIVDDASTGPQVIPLAYNYGGATFPPTVDFGHWAIGATADDFLQIVGPGISGGFTFTLSGPNASDFSAPSSCSYDYRNRNYCYINIVYKPTPLITSTAYIDITGNGNNFGRMTLIGRADPAGMDFDLFQTPPSGIYSTLYAAPITAIPFPNTAVGTTSSFTFSIQNTGTVSPLVLYLPAISGPNAADFAVTAPVCSTGCYPTVTFTPSGTGPRSATLTYSVGPITRNIPLTGAGY